MRCVVFGGHSVFAAGRVIARRMSKHSTQDPSPALSGGSAEGGKHLQVTAQHSRQPSLAPAKVTRVWQASPSVKCLELSVERERKLTFKAGQWVDLYIPGVETVGGFSMCSSPSQLKSQGTLDLGVKFSKWPPAHWVHTECKVGSEVTVRVGGDFHYPPPPPHHTEGGGGSLPTYPLLLVGGGVGVNPLAAILFELHSLHMEERVRGGSVLLLYSARNYEELLYKEQLKKVSSEINNIEVSYFTSREPPPHPSLATYGRIGSNSLMQALTTLSSSQPSVPPLCYLCGPPPMLRDISCSLEACGVPRDRILYEKWW